VPMAHSAGGPGGGRRRLATATPTKTPGSNWAKLPIGAHNNR